MLPAPQGDFKRLPLADNGSLSSIPAFAGCYRIICIMTGRCYVGSTYHLVKRFLEHRHQLYAKRHPNSWLQREFDRRGPTAFRFQVLEIYHGRWKPDCLAPAEQRWLNKHHRLFNVRPAGSDAYLGIKRNLLGVVKRRAGRPIGGPHRVSEVAKLASRGLKPVAGGVKRHPGRTSGTSKRTS